MKRRYAKSEYRSSNLGKRLVDGVWVEKHQKMVLDTVESVRSVIRLYERHRFVGATSYYENPVKGVVCMEPALRRRFCHGSLNSDSTVATLFLRNKCCYALYPRIGG